MSRSFKDNCVDNQLSPGLVGVGLRHPHVSQAMSGTSSIDFVEVHAENYFSPKALSYLETIRAQYPVSVHATSLGLGSAIGINEDYLKKLDHLVERIEPLLVSDHACFSWSQFNGNLVHAGDLLPLEFSRESLQVLIENVDRVQQHLGRQILIENLSVYMDLGQADFSEAEFLAEVAELTQCGLLVDLNNILINAHNQKIADPIHYGQSWLNVIPDHYIHEIHLAGYTPVSSSNLIIDDHSQPVNDQCWRLYEYAIATKGPVTTLIEWDNDLPSWETLLNEAEKAKRIMKMLAVPENHSFIAQRA